MLRIIDGEIFEGKPAADRFVLTLHDLGHGHREACVQRATDWEHVGPLDPDSICAQVLRGEMVDPQAAEKLEANRKRSARRAKTRVRRLCKALGVDCLLTLTYKSNQTDLALCKVHFKEFVRRLKRTLPGFSYVAAFEQQKRGAWHVHIATHKLPPAFMQSGVRVKSFNVLRAVWRGVTKEHGGNIDGQKARPYHSPARLAAYLSKYMLKVHADGVAGSERFSSSTFGNIPKPIRLEFCQAQLADLIGLAVSEVCIGDSDNFTWLSRFGDTFYVSSEPSKGIVRPWEIN